MLEWLSTIFHRGTIFASMTSSCNGEGKTEKKKQLRKLKRIEELGSRESRRDVPVDVCTKGIAIITILTRYLPTIFTSLV